MSRGLRIISRAIERLRAQDPTFKEICLYGKRLDDDEVNKFINVLLLYPNIIDRLNLRYNNLTDVTGIKLAHYIAISSTIQWLDLERNNFSEVTYLALAEALRINTSLQILIIKGNPTCRHRIDAAFIEALYVNPNRPPFSTWELYHQSTLSDNDFWRFRKTTRQLEHPNMQSLLSVYLDTMILK